MEQRLAGAVIGSANSHDSIENRETAARRPIKFGIQVGICREQGLYDIAVESIELAMGAGGGRDSIGRAGEQTDFTDVVAGANEASRLLSRKSTKSSMSASAAHTRGNRWQSAKVMGSTAML